MDGYKNKWVFNEPVVLDVLPLNNSSVQLNSSHIFGEDTSFILTNTSKNNEYYIDIDILLYTESSKNHYTLRSYTENVLQTYGTGILNSGDSAEFTMGFLMNCSAWNVTLPNESMEDIMFATLVKCCYPDGLISGRLYGDFVDNEFAKKAMGITDADNGDTPFTDVPKASYYHDAVLWALQNKITQGTSKTTFSPAATCTRGQVATFLWRASGSPEPKTTSNPFADVKESDYFYKAVLWAYENKITNGTSKTTFDPEGTCTSAHVITFLWRANGKPAADHSGTEYYAEAVAWANENDLLAGTDTPFAPENLSPRADIVTYLYRVMAK